MKKEFKEFKELLNNIDLEIEVDEDYDEEDYEATEKGKECVFEGIYKCVLPEEIDMHLEYYSRRCKVILTSDSLKKISKAIKDFDLFKTSERWIVLTKLTLTGSLIIKIYKQN